MTKHELIERLKECRSWKEAGLSIDEVCDILEQPCDCMSGVSGSDEIHKLREKVDRLSESNKQLRAENRALKGMK